MLSIKHNQPVVKTIVVSNLKRAIKTIDEVWLFKMLGESIDLYMARELKFFPFL